MLNFLAFSIHLSRVNNLPIETSTYTIGAEYIHTLVEIQFFVKLLTLSITPFAHKVNSMLIPKLLILVSIVIHLSMESVVALTRNIKIILPKIRRSSSRWSKYKEEEDEARLGPITVTRRVGLINIKRKKQINSKGKRKWKN